MGKELTFKKVIETQKELIYIEGFDRLESTELAIDNRKFLRNRLYESSPFHKMQTRPTGMLRIFFFWTFVLLRFN